LNTNETTSIEILDPLPNGHEDRPAWNAIPDETREAIIEDVLRTNSISKTAENFGLARVTVAAVIKDFRAEIDEFNDFRYQARIEKVLDKLLHRLENEADEIKTSQLPVTTAILLDKRRELRGKTLNAQGPLNLRVAWRDGSGAVELTAGGGRNPGLDTVDLSISGPAPGCHGD